MTISGNARNKLIQNEILGYGPHQHQLPQNTVRIATDSSHPPGCAFSTVCRSDILTTAEGMDDDLFQRILWDIFMVCCYTVNPVGLL